MDVASCEGAATGEYGETVRQITKLLSIVQNADGTRPFLSLSDGQCQIVICHRLCVQQEVDIFVKYLDGLVMSDGSPRAFSA
jgi:hypothetical protein